MSLELYIRLVQIDRKTEERKYGAWSPDSIGRGDYMVKREKLLDPDHDYDYECEVLESKTMTKPFFLNRWTPKKEAT